MALLLRDRANRARSTEGGGSSSDIGCSIPALAKSMRMGGGMVKDARFVCATIKELYGEVQ